MDQRDREVKIEEEGLDFILDHFEEPTYDYRTVSTYVVEGKQKFTQLYASVNNKQLALARYKAANFLDCRISAWPKYTNDYINRTGIAPTVLHVDIDIRQFETIEQFELAVVKTYTNFEEILHCKPTQLWTGRGVHFIQPQSIPVLEKLDDFRKFDEPSRRFIHFEQKLLTENKCDQTHSKVLSFNNCMLRIPWSLNSHLVQSNERGKILDIPPEAEVSIMKRWDGNRPPQSIIKPLLTQYYVWLQAETIKDIQRRKQEQKECKRRYRQGQGRIGQGNKIIWIERLLDKSLDDFRKYCIWRVLVPYFINVKGLSRLDTFDATKYWLDKCNSVSRLDFSAKEKIDYTLDNVGSYPPIPQSKLEEDNNPFYLLLKKEGILTSGGGHQ